MKVVILSAQHELQRYIAEIGREHPKGGDLSRWIRICILLLLCIP